MEITEVKVFPVDEEKLKAFVSIVFDRSFMVNDIKIIQGRDGLFISMPSRKKKNGEFKDVAHPLNNETRQMIEQVVVGEYQRVLEERGEELPAPPRQFPVDGAETADGGGDGSASGAGSASDAGSQINAGSRINAGGQINAGGGRIDGRLPERGEAPAGELPIAAAEAGNTAGPAAASGDGDAPKSLEEVQELHLRDSFWSVS
jgi:stage V sporulation protein G